MKIVQLIFVLSILVSCGSNNVIIDDSGKVLEPKIDPVVSDQLQETPINQASAFAHTDIDKDVWLYFKRGVCFGQCPNDDISVYKDGRVLYNGYKNTEIRGVKEFKLTTEQLLTLERLSKSFDTNVIGDITKNQPSDLPSKELILKKDGMVFSYRYRLNPANDKKEIAGFLIEIINNIPK